MRFKDFPGAEKQKANLWELYQSGKVSHAHLFHSSEGGISLPMALAFATLLNCENPRDGDSCGECSSCRRMASLTHPDVHFSFPLTTTNEIKRTDDLKCESFLVPWREFVLENPFASYQGWSEKFAASEKLNSLKNMEIIKREAKEIIQSQALTTFDGKHKIFIVWSSERLNDSTANTLLKIVEEPTPGTIFIFVSFHLENHLKTLLSRVQIHSFPPLTSTEVAGILSHNFEIGDEVAEKASLVSGGSVSEALHLAGSPNRVDFEEIQVWFRDCFSFDFAKLQRSAEDFSRSNGHYQRGFFRVGLRVLENSLSSRRAKDQGWNEGLNNFFSDFYNNVGLEKFESIRKEMEDGLYLLDRNIQPRLLFLQKSIQLNKILRNKK